MKVCIDNFDQKEWKSNSRYFRDYSVYQMWEYQQVRAARAGQQLSRILIFNDNGSPVLMGQMRIQKIPVLGLKVGYFQWGPLIQCESYDESSARQALILLKQSFLGSKVSVLRLKPNIEDDHQGEQWNNLFSSAGFKKVTNVPPYQTLIVSLAESPEQILSTMDREARRNIRKAEKANVEFKEGTSDEFFDTLKHLYAQAKERKGFHGIDADDFAEAQKLFAEEDKLKVLIAYHENKPVTAHATAHIGLTAEPIIAANTPNGLKLGSSYLIWWKAYLRAKELGMRFYNLGGIDKKLNPNGYTFKRRMGGREVVHICSFEACVNPLAEKICHAGEWAYHLIKK
jgi:lipid II:glycine glycyltransferase (peptidoglycan interpeptide bridge formation enzyme)